MSNRIKELHQQGKPAFGAYINFNTTAMAQFAASVGLDFVRFDLRNGHINPETMDDMIRAMYGYDAVPWVQCRLNPVEIDVALQAGAQAIMISVTSVEDARAAVAAVRYPPVGERELKRPLRFMGEADTNYQEWIRDEPLLCISIGSAGGWQNYKEIVKVEGADIVNFGKHTVAAALGVARELSGYGPEPDPRLLEAEKAVVFAALAAGKQALLMDSLTPYGLERLMRWVEQGVLTIGLDVFADVLHRTYSDALDTMRRGRVQ